MKKINILLVDDHTIVRDGIKATLKDQKNFHIVGEAANGLDGIEAVKQLKPDVVIMDITMPEMSGIEAADVISKKYPDSKVLILSMHDNETYILKSVEAGAYGYLLKDVDKDEFIKAITAVYNGDKYFNTAISSVLVSGYLSKVKQTDSIQSGYSNDEYELTKREKGILKMITDGKNNREIADGLGISIRTIETHRANIMKKLKVKNAVELVRIAIDEKIV
ncbi:response regulator [Cytophaga hutchinsonii]|uniref:Response regulator n=1 Tax=Cytophaga hutchinsonii (strain ATCC 33406 / DSM 1761 / CIP 103989 / NBRC 15051 / NCIMB 9469 / D465) TaxID=269798 RepID=A0A6N4SQK3_CYTH3|nr:response regulator transcription factor [Cytophaga hutchinsonii]ABG58589.1 response regulator [Cytophaga hutchinsonii ATCC 33406]SFX77714.1 two component transcriptional regulator, LuxR family [Cytophaga hutchinsonii ATCC 33406]